MKKIPSIIYQFALTAAKALSFLLLLLLFLSGLLRTAYAENMTTQQVLLGWDNLPFGLPALALAGLLVIFLAQFFCKNPRRGKKLLLAAVFAWILLLGCILILLGKTVPAADAMSVYGAAEALARGDVSVIHPTDSYLSYYPQQVGLMAFLEVLHRIWNLFGIGMPAYHFIKGIYVLLLCFAVYFQYKTVHLLWEDDRTDCLYLLLSGANLPLIMYSSFVYGEIPSFTAFSVGLYFLLKFLQKTAQPVVSSLSSKNSDDDTEAIDTNAPDSASSPGQNTRGRNLRGILSALCSLIFMTLCVMLRKNALILIIAVIIVLAFEALRRRKFAPLILAVLTLICTVSILPITERYYERRADNTLSSGVTPLSYLAMGMQEASRGNGWYNGFNYETYQSTGMDTDLTNEISRKAIQERRTYFQEHPDYARAFYRDKFLTQWADGTYASRQATLATFGGRSALFDSIYVGAGSKYYIAYCNIYQNILYLGSLLFCIGFSISAARRRKQSSKKEPLQNDSPLAGLPTYLGLIGVLGGFLFHMIWEANSRYIFVYGLLLLPYAARGLNRAASHHLITRITDKCLSRRGGSLRLRK